MEKYTGEVVPFQKYDGEVLPLEQEVTQKTLTPEQEAERVKKVIADARANQMSGFDIVDTGVTALANAGQGAIHLGLSGVDYAAGTELAPAFNKAVPRIDYGNKFGQQLTGNVIEAIPGAIAGDKGFTKVFGTAQNAGRVGKIVNAAGRATAANVGASTGQDINDWQALGIHDIDPNDPEALQTLKKRANLAETSMILGMAAGGVAGTVKYIGQGLGWVNKSIFKAGSVDAEQQRFVSELMDVFAGVDVNTPPEIYKEKIKQATDLVSRNSQLIAKFGDPSVQDIIEQKDTITAMIESLNPKNAQDAQIIATLEGIRSSALSGEGPVLKTAMEAPERALTQGLDQAQTTRGGDTMIGKAKDNIVAQGRAEVQAPYDAAASKQTDLALAEKDTTGLIEHDPILGKKLKDAQSKGVDLQAGQASLDDQVELAQAARTRQQSDMKTKNAAYETLGDARADADSFYKAYDEASPWVPNDIKKSIDTQRALGQEDGKNFSYRYLNNIIKPQLSSEIQIARQAGDGEKVRMLSRLQDNIRKDQLTALTESGDEITAQSAIAARQANKEYSSLHKDGLGGELRETSIDYDPKTYPIKWEEESTKKILSAIKDPARRKSVEQLIKIVGPDHADKVANVAMYEAFQDITNAVNFGNKKLTDLEVSDVASKLQDMVAAFPAGQRGRIQGFLTKLRDKKITAEQLKMEYDSLSEFSKKNEEDVYGVALKDFFKKQGGKYVDQPNGFEIFNTMMRDKQGQQRMADVIARGTKDPAIKKGLEAAWAKAAKDRLLPKGASEVGVMDDAFMNYGRQIYGSNSSLPEMISALRDKTEVSQAANRVRMTKGIDVGKGQHDLKAASNLVITFIWGVLNPTAARIRGVTNQLIKKYDVRDKSKVALDTVIGNAEEFSRIAKEISDKKMKELTPKQKTMIYRILRRGGISYLQDIDDQTIEAQGGTLQE